MRVVVQPCSNPEAYQHYIDTILNPVALETIQSRLSASDMNILNEYFPDGFSKVWGVTPPKKKEWEQLSMGDAVLFYRNKAIFEKGTVVHKLHHPSLAESLWGKDKKGHTWEYIYFLDEIEKRTIPIEQFNTVLDYEENYFIQSFHVYSEKKSTLLINAFNLLSDTYQPPVSQSQVIQELDEEEQKEKSNVFAGRESLDIRTSGVGRVEQAYLRTLLFKNKKTAICGICGKEYPVSLLIAAHIKKRVWCTKEEKRDFHNVVMPMCKFGCDDLYEKGFIYIEDGMIKVRTKGINCKDLEAYLDQIKDKPCPHYNEKTKKYFDYHKMYIGVDD